jgi:hypothetical protein
MKKSCPRAGESDVKFSPTPAGAGEKLRLAGAAPGRASVRNTPARKNECALSTMPESIPVELIFVAPANPSGPFMPPPAPQQPQVPVTPGIPPTVANEMYWSAAAANAYDGGAVPAPLPAGAEGIFPPATNMLAVPGMLIVVAPARGGKKGMQRIAAKHTKARTLCEIMTSPHPELYG